MLVSRTKSDSLAKMNWACERKILGGKWSNTWKQAVGSLKQVFEFYLKTKRCENPWVGGRVGLWLLWKLLIG